LQSQNAGIGTPPIPGYGLGKNSRDARIRDLGIASYNIFPAKSNLHQTISLNCGSTGACKQSNTNITSSSYCTY